MIDDKNINEWLTRFFNGDTTCDEEKALFACFRQTNIPSSVEQYREMMKWYDTGLQREYNEDEIQQKKLWILIMPRKFEIILTHIKTIHF